MSSRIKATEPTKITIYLKTPEEYVEFGEMRFYRMIIEEWEEEIKRKKEEKR